MGDFFMIRNRLAELLSERQLKISRVANEIPNLSRNTITSTAQNSGKMIQLETINSLCKYLGITPGEFFEYIPYDLELSIDDIKMDGQRDDYDQPLTVDEGKMTFTLFIKLLGKSTQQYTYEYSVTNVTRFTIAKGLSLLLDFKENSDGYSFSYFWKGKVTPGFQAIIQERIKEKISYSLIEYENDNSPYADRDPYVNQLSILMRSNFYTDGDFDSKLKTYSDTTQGFNSSDFFDSTHNLPF